MPCRTNRVFPIAPLVRAALLASMPFLWAAVPVQAASVVSVSPQGEVAQVRQLVVKFDEAMVPAGDARATAPADVRCTDPAARGQGRWLEPKIWAYDFDQDLPPGVRCDVQLHRPLTAVSGKTLTGRTAYAFNTGGPFVSRIRPSYGPIDEAQAFILQLNGPADPDSLRKNVWCETEGIGERIGVTPVEGEPRAALLKRFQLEKDAARVAIVQCNRTLAPGAKMQLVWGAGVATPSGIVNRMAKRFEFQVREPFTANFTCERENAKAPCTPLRPLRLEFSAPVARAIAEKIRLRAGNGSAASRSPTFDDSDKNPTVSAVSFAAPFPERAELTITLPDGLADDSGRKLANAGMFPLATHTAAMPPLAKFAAAPFGIVERFAEPGMPPMLPVTLRNVEAALGVQGLAVAGPAAQGGKVAQLRVDNDADILKWLSQVRQFDETTMSLRDIGREMPSLLNNPAARDALYGPNAVTQTVGREKRYDTRSLPLLAGLQGVQPMALPVPKTNDPRPFEVVGIPFQKPGFYVVEIASPSLGAALLGKSVPMYVRTTTLVTNLGVHFKQGRENSAVWVTSLDKGKPVPNAKVKVLDCDGGLVAEASTDAQGVASIAQALPRAGYCEKTRRSGYFVVARTGGADPDMAFVFSEWNRGIEPWRFNVPTDDNPAPTVRAQTVFDRMLFRAGETVSMKHFIRTQTQQGLALPKQLPAVLTITHEGSGQTYTLPLQWRAGRLADSSFQIPPGAKLGEYSVTMRYDDADNAGRSPREYQPTLSTGSFRVEAFRLPVLAGTIAVREAGRLPLVGVTEAPLSVQLNYVAGGPAGNVPVQVSALLRPRALSFADFDAYSFAPYKPAAANAGSATDEDDGDQAAQASDQKLVADKQRLVLDRHGAGTLTLKNLPRVTEPGDLVLEASFADPNGEIQTLRGGATLWPAALVTGIRTDSWVSIRGKLPVKAVALDLQGRPKSGVAMEIRAVARITTSSRKRMVGGFYAYDNHTETKDLGTVCSGNSDSHGLFTCDAKLSQAGDVTLIARALDDKGNLTTSSTGVWVTRQGEVWFGGDNTDRMDVIPERRTYQPGETAKLQVRMPFRRATALVSIEREGIVETRTVEIAGQDPSIDLKIAPEWGPNIYVSILAVRGRIHDVPWYSFFTWGWKQPLEWVRAFWYEGREYQAPTALVDLGKPAYRFGVTELRIDTASHRLGIEVKPDAATYPVRGHAKVKLRVTQPDGEPVPAGTEVAVAAVDEALLELAPNTSWDLLDAMWQRRSYGVSTSTAQMEIIGRRHYGRKAVPAGGGGGKSPTRELFDTLLLWQPRVTVDAQGEATVDVPLNDSLSSFRIVAVADAALPGARGLAVFGTGSATIRATQDLQLISGLPPLVREGDDYRAQFTVRNTTKHAMRVQLTARATALVLQPQTVDVPAGEAREVMWPVVAPPGLADTRAQSLIWEVNAQAPATAGAPAASDALKVSQQIAPALPATVQQAVLTQVEGSLSMPMAPPAGSVADSTGKLRGGVRVSLQPRLAQGMPGVQRWFAAYPYACLEQLTSKALGLRDIAQWRRVMGLLPSYLDDDGLATYFPPQDGFGAQGSDTLTAYLLSVSAEARGLDPAYVIPDDAQTRMLDGLSAFVEGRLSRRFWAPRDDLALRKLSAIEALSRYGRANARMLGALTVTPNQWPTSAVLDWYNILQRLPDVPQRAERIAQADQILRARLSYQGTRVVFSTEREDALWWLMVGPEVNAARLALTMNDNAAWKDDMPRLLIGLLGMQHRGAWSTTTANLWGSLAVSKFSVRFEAQSPAGHTAVQWLRDNQTVGHVQSIDWDTLKAGANPPPVSLPWPPQSASAPGRDLVRLEQAGAGRPWATIESMAAVPLKAPITAGYRVTKTVEPQDATERTAQGFMRGAVLRVRLDIDAQADMRWVVVSDPLPGGATVLGGGLGRDSVIATRGENSEDGSRAVPAFEERATDAYRAYFDYLPKGQHRIEYTVRLNNVGTFAVPPTRVEAMYEPAMYGESPNTPVRVAPAANR
ncbi:alpha-2-macroglobulin [Pandoraea terrae]|uniref:Alpha-2-macroglobulin n=1 Tax=Pandoraea terrae TaxID=1537710 RepID=A0A5E4VZG3_9BURK|nr:MG2 domain-containing protein [Pandoraea terrae]VVE17772.1 alpha-2-macroglobulin [Pandoraea terrae]